MNELLIQAEAALQRAIDKRISHGEVSLTLVFRDAKMIRYVIQTTESILTKTLNTSADVNTEICK